MPHTLKRATNQ